ncbi:DUF1275 family protein [Actinomadura rugatobispora]|uniref:DUF1275 family protein n=1 Tax=Actinomadura rugatobispora TaxID=1994 RepID=A0ABW1AA58_9ACTN|nr:hypothetical protein GCM10010200_092080 [Actinomadura rugatobispora]
MRLRLRVPESGLARTALTLTVVAGLVDAAAFMVLGGVFVANQTGNCVLLAIGIAERIPIGDAGADRPHAGVTGPLMSLAAFCAGAAAAGWGGLRVPRRVAAFLPLLGAEALLLAAAAALPGPDWARVGLVAAAMGVQSVQAVRLEVPGVTTTVVTGTLASLFDKLTDERPRRRGTGLLTLVWVLYIAGAVAGALGARLWSFTAVCWCAVALTVLRAALSEPPGR